jgi:hypothetical protein
MISWLRQLELMPSTTQGFGTQRQLLKNAVHPYRAECHENRSELVKGGCDACEDTPQITMCHISSRGSEYDQKVQLTFFVDGHIYIVKYPNALCY